MNSRSKGKRGELELAKLLAAGIGVEVVRNLDQVRDGGHDLDVPGIALEVKRHETLRVKEWWEQAVGQAGDRIPVLAYRKNRHPWRFVLPGSAVGLAWCGHDYDDTVECGIELFLDWYFERFLVGH